MKESKKYPEVYYRCLAVVQRGFDDGDQHDKVKLPAGRIAFLRIAMTGSGLLGNIYISIPGTAVDKLPSSRIDINQSPDFAAPFDYPIFEDTGGTELDVWSGGNHVGVSIGVYYEFEKVSR